MWSPVLAIGSVAVILKCFLYFAELLCVVLKGDQVGGANFQMSHLLKLDNYLLDDRVYLKSGLRNPESGIKKKQK